MRKNKRATDKEEKKRAARATRTLEQFRAFSSRQQLEITTFAYIPRISLIL